MKPILIKILMVLGAALLATGCSVQPVAPALPVQDSNPSATEEIVYTLQSGTADGELVYVGVGGEIEGLINPDLTVTAGETVRIVFLNGDGISHDLALPDASVQTPLVLAKGDSQDLVLTLTEPGTHTYLCSVSGHRQAGLAGRLIVRDP